MTAMSIVAHTHPFVVGVDTHARNHVYAILAANTGALLESRDFPATGAGINRAIDWVARRTDGSADTLWDRRCRILRGDPWRHRGHPRFPCGRGTALDARKRRGVGKTDALDAHRIAISTLPLPVDKLRRPRLHDGIRQGVRILITARGSMSKDRTRSINALNALVRGNDLGIDGRNKLTSTQITEVSKWRSREEELSLSIARTEAVRLARHILLLDEQLTANENQLDELVKVSEAAPLVEETGFAAISAAKCLAAWSHEGRVRNEAAFASLAGVNPIPASSGNTARHQLNRGGDRSLNSALHMVAVTKMTHDTKTREYAEKRRAQGRTNKEIRRCIKRYLARHIYRTLNASATQTPLAMAA